MINNRLIKISFVILVMTFISFIQGCEKNISETKSNFTMKEFYPILKYNINRDLAFLGISRQDVIHILEKNGIKEGQDYQISIDKSFGFTYETIYFSKHENLLIANKEEKGNFGPYLIELVNSSQVPQSINQHKFRSISIDLIQLVDSEKKIDASKIYNELELELLDSLNKDETVTPISTNRIINGILLNLIITTTKPPHAITFTIVKLK